jgi:hypothetical protein
MRKTRLCALPTLLCLFFVAGCGKAEPRFAGIVQSHTDTYRSGTGATTNLVGGLQQVASGFHYGDGKKTDWKSEIHWRLIARRGDSDVYEFSWLFSPAGGTASANKKEVEYNGKESVIVFKNDSEIVSIEPGSIPLPQNPDKGH